MALLHHLRQFARTHLPAAARHALKKLSYPFVLRRFTEEQWPYGSVVRRLLKPGDRVVDVGANIGCVTVLLSRWVGDSGLVYSIEPVPETFDLLRHNIRALRLRNVRPMNCGLSSSDRKASMRIPLYTDGVENLYEAHVAGPVEGQGRLVDVELRRLDSVLAADDVVRFVKIDTEGHELEVVRGAEQVLKRSRPVLLIEIDGNPDEPGSSAFTLFSYLRGFGYRDTVLHGEHIAEREQGRAAVDYLFVQHADFKTITNT